MSEQRTIAWNRKATTEDIILAYRETGSVWKAAKRLGMAGQSVHERLVAAGYKLVGSRWTDEETCEMESLIRNGVRLGDVARRLGRPYGGVAMKASKMGIRSSPARPRKLPRGAGYDKSSTLRHMDAIERFDGKPTQYARSRGLDIEMLAQTFERHCPERWRAYVASRSDLPQRGCPYCETTFIPHSGKQQYCSRKCASDARADRNYFGGKRRTAVGMDTFTCQLCGKQGRRGLTPHHVLGKENDPENDQLVAVCPGCHKLVTLAATRTFVDDQDSWADFIALAWLRRHGPEIAAGTLTENTLHVTVEIETYTDEETG